MPIKTKNFNPDIDKKLLCTCGHADCDKRSVHQWVLDKVQLIRDDIGIGLVVTSAGRCPNHPNEVHRSKPADHQNCVAVDIKVTNGFDRLELVRLGLKHGATSIGVGKTFVHLGFRNIADGVMWTY